MPLDCKAYLSNSSCGFKIKIDGDYFTIDPRFGIGEKHGWTVQALDTHFVSSEQDSVMVSARGYLGMANVRKALSSGRSVEKMWMLHGCLY